MDLILLELELCSLVNRNVGMNNLFVGFWKLLNRLKEVVGIVLLRIVMEFDN